MSKSTPLSASVWNRRQSPAVSSMSRQLYMLMVCLWTGLGIVMSAFAANISQDWPVRSWGWGWLGFSLGVLVVAIAGSAIATASDNPVVSTLGYVLVAGPFGLLLGPIVAQYETSSVVKVFALTSLVVVVLGLVGALIPDDLSSWGVPLLGALLLLIGGYFVVPILGFFGIPVAGAMTVLDWLGLVVFGGLIIFDLNRAVRLPHTMDNAIDCAVQIYLDFINVFMFLLRIMGQKK